MPIPYTPPSFHNVLLVPPMNPNDWRARAVANEQVLNAIHAAAYAGRLGSSHFCFLRDRDRYARADAISSFR